MNCPTACVTRLGWDEVTPLCRKQPQAKKTPKKRGAYPKSGAAVLGSTDFKLHSCSPHTWPRKAEDHQQPFDDKLQLAIFQVKAPLPNLD